MNTSAVSACAPKTRPECPGGRAQELGGRALGCPAGQEGRKGVSNAVQSDHRNGAFRTPDQVALSAQGYYSFWNILADRSAFFGCSQGWEKQL